MDPLPPFHDDLDAARAEVWRLLEEGPALRRNAFHMPALATVDAAGHPQVRTVVLREADPAAGALRFHCDRRSDKASEIAASGHAATLHSDDALAEAAWAGAMAMSRICYGADPAPGAVLPRGDAYTLPDAETALTLGRPNFCAVVVRVARLEFLYLDRRGHRRAAWERAGNWRGCWLAP